MNVEKTDTQSFKNLCFRLTTRSNSKVESAMIDRAHLLSTTDKMNYEKIATVQ